MLADRDWIGVEVEHTTCACDVVFLSGGGQLQRAESIQLDDDATALVAVPNERLDAADRPGGQKTSNRVPTKGRRELELHFPAFLNSLHACSAASAAAFNFTHASRASCVGAASAPS